jgi:hypothetical protein
MVRQYGLTLRATAAGWEVVGVAARSSARRAGFRRGEVIVSLHRLPVARSALGPTLLEHWDGYGRVDVRLRSGVVRARWVNLRGRG